MEGRGTVSSSFILKFQWPCSVSELDFPLFFFRAFQLAILFFLQKSYSDFELQGVSETEINSKIYQTVCSRLQVSVPVISLFTS